MKHMTYIILLTLFVMFSTNTLHARFSKLETASIDKPIVIELFTSQSCSSCPAADKNLVALSQNPNVIALGFHVTYWNHLHWKDTLSNEFSSDRQRAYAAYKRSNRVYTPQMIVNGQSEFVGSRSGDVNRSVKAAKALEPIQISKNGASELQITLPNIKKGTYTLWLAGVKTQHTQSIPSGENRGRTVSYSNAVLTYEKAGNWNGESKALTLKAPQNEKIGSYIILAQENGYGPIRAAGKLAK